MAIPSIYINLEDDVSKIITRLKAQSARQVVLVCPKRCFLFNDSINLRLLKKQVDLLGKDHG
jgi:ABC-type transport system involved in Fe-S cluster assembly fused permease/ATPase subunit